MSNLNYSDFKRMPILVPPKVEQNQIIEFIEKLKNKIAIAISLKEQEIEKLKEYKGADYTLHIAKNDELLHFDKILDYINTNGVMHNIFEYDTNHRFEKMEELLDNIQSKLI